MDHGTQMSGDCTEVSNTPETTELSVVLPVYNEKDNLIQMHAELKRSLDNIGKPYEILFVDDGSDDGSMGILEDISSTDCSVRVVQFRRNFGQTAALAAGLRAAEGEVVVTMDADRQNDPKDIGMLLREIAQGMDLVLSARIIPINFRAPRRNFPDQRSPSTTYGFWSVLSQKIAKFAMLMGIFGVRASRRCCSPSVPEVAEV